MNGPFAHSHRRGFAGDDSEITSVEEVKRGSTLAQIYTD
jgi:hypothetical protein